MALKYLFGLDDVSEYCVKSSESFSILHWMTLSRQRAFVACKHSPMFNTMLSEELFDGDVQMTPNAWYEHTKLCRKQRIHSRNHKDIPDSQFYTGTRELCNDLAEDLFSHDLQEEFKSKEGRSLTVNLLNSHTPLNDFACKCVREGEMGTPLDSSEIEALRELLKMQEASLGLKCAEDDAISVELQPPMVTQNLQYLSDIFIHGKHQEFEKIVFVNKLESSIVKNNPLPMYWRSRFLNKRGNYHSSEYHSLAANQLLLSMLPENFGWILRYFAGLFGLRASEIYYELIKIEDLIEAKEPGYFGQYHNLKNSLFALNCVT